MTNQYVAGHVDDIDATSSMMIGYTTQRDISYVDDRPTKPAFGPGRTRTCSTIKCLKLLSAVQLPE